MQSDYKMNRIGFCLISILLLSTTTVFDVSSELIIRPTTFIQYFIEQVPVAYFNCSSTLGSNAITWTFVPFNGGIIPNVTLIVNGSTTVETTFTGVRYTVEQFETNASNLIIYNDDYKSSLNYIYSAGMYTCSDGSASNSSAEFIFYFRSGVAGTVSTYQPKASNNTILEGELVVLEVFISYTVPIRSKFTAYPIIRLIANNQLLEDNINNTQSDVFIYVISEFGTEYQNIPLVNLRYFYNPSLIPECGHVPSVVYELTVLGIMQNTSTEYATYIPWTSLNIDSGVTTFKPIYIYCIEPTFGPISGGTMVNVSGWSNTFLNISSVYIGTNLQANITGTDRLNGCLFILTPKTNESFIGKQMMIIIEFFSFNVSTNQYFTFLDDPQIIDINPKKYIISGGTTVTINGTSLNSVAKPFIRTTLVVNRSNGTNFTSTSTDSEEPCLVPSEYFGNEMFCTMPTINLPEDFLVILENMTSNYNSVAPSPISLNHSSVAQSIVGANGKDTADIILGFVFDGDKKYENINSAIPSPQFQFFSSPGIQFRTGIIQFEPNVDDTGISIKGEHLQLGCQLTDYMATIGNGTCRNLHLTENELDCEPPKEKPQRIAVDDTYCDSSSFVIMVNIGNIKFAYECLVYKSDDDVVGLIVGLVVGLSFLMLIVVIIIIVVVVKSRRLKQRHSKAAIHRDSNDPDSSTSGQSSVMSSNLSRSATNGFEGEIKSMTSGNNGLRFSPGVALQSNQDQRQSVEWSTEDDHQRLSDSREAIKRFFETGYLMPTDQRQPIERSVEGQGSSNQLLRRSNEYSTEIDQFVPDDVFGVMTMDGSNIHSSSSSSHLRPSTTDTLMAKPHRPNQTQLN